MALGRSKDRGTPLIDQERIELCASPLELLGQPLATGGPAVGPTTASHQQDSLARPRPMGNDLPQRLGIELTGIGGGRVDLRRRYAALAKALRGTGTGGEPSQALRPRRGPARQKVIDCVTTDQHHRRVGGQLLLLEPQGIGCDQGVIFSRGRA